MENEIEILNNVIANLETIDKSAKKDGVFHHYIEFLKNNNSIVLAGNKEGLIYLSICLLKLAHESQEGKHYHLDKNSMLDRNDFDLILKYTKPNWD